MNRQGGFTLVEVMVVLLLIGPIFGLIISSSTVATRTLNTNETVASTAEGLHRTMQRLAQFVRPCVLSTYSVEATSADVTNGRATSVGEWISPVDGEARSVVRFRSATGDLSMNASSLTLPRTIRFILDPSEVANTIDDDGDGFVDEGRVVLDYDGVAADMVIHAEECTFTLVGRELTIRVSAVSRSRDSVISRMRTSQVLNLRNN